MIELYGDNMIWNILIGFALVSLFTSAVVMWFGHNLYRYRQARKRQDYQPPHWRSEFLIKRRHKYRA